MSELVSESLRKLKSELVENGYGPHADFLEQCLTPVVNASVGAAVEACAKHRPCFNPYGPPVACSFGWSAYESGEFQNWEEHIRTLYPAATEELEKRMDAALAAWEGAT